jgi:hypothetical protein
MTATNQGNEVCATIVPYHRAYQQATPWQHNKHLLSCMPQLACVTHCAAGAAEDMISQEHHAQQQQQSSQKKSYDADDDRLESSSRAQLGPHQ